MSLEAASYHEIVEHGLVFTSLEALQDHVRAAHPGERIPISIQWQGA